MSSFLEMNAANVTPPGAGAKVAVPSAASTTAGVLDMTTHKGKWLWVKADAKVHLRAGATYAAATAGDIYLTADVDYQMRVPEDGTLSKWSAYGAAAGNIYYRVTSGPV